MMDEGNDVRRRPGEEARVFIFPLGGHQILVHRLGMGLDQPQALDLLCDEEKRMCFSWVFIFPGPGVRASITFRVTTA